MNITLHQGSMWDSFHHVPRNVSPVRLSLNPAETQWTILVCPRYAIEPSYYGPVLQEVARIPAWASTGALEMSRQINILAAQNYAQGPGGISYVTLTHEPFIDAKEFLRDLEGRLTYMGWAEVTFYQHNESTLQITLHAS